MTFICVVCWRRAVPAQRAGGRVDVGESIERGEVDVGTIIVRRLASHSKVRDASQVQGAPTRSPGPGNDVQRDDFLFMTVVVRFCRAMA